MKFSYVFILGLLLISFACAIPPVQTTVVENKALQIEVPIIEPHKFNTTFKFHIHIYNATDGVLIPQSNINYCNIHVYRPSDGGHIIEDNMTIDGNGVDWKYDVLGGNFTEFGQYAVIFYCEVDPALELRGGFFEHAFTITENGRETPTGVPTFMLGIIGLIFLTACLFLYLSSQMGETAFKIFFMLLSLVFLMGSFITAYMYSSDVNISSEINVTTLSLIYVLGAVLIIMFVYILIRQTINALDMFNIKRGREWSVGSGGKVGGYNTKRAY